MNTKEALAALLPLFTRYYTIKEDTVSTPFSAEAEFHSHNEQYFLVKAAKIADIDSNEFVFFAETDFLDTTEFEKLDAAAWQEGLSRIQPFSGHRNSDVTLVIVANKIDAHAFSLIQKRKHYKSYKCSFWGWSHYKLLALETTSGKTACNRMGRDLQELLKKLPLQEETSL